MRESKFYGYARSVAADQQIDRQVKLLEEHGVKLEAIFMDKGSGMTMQLRQEACSVLFILRKN